MREFTGPVVAKTVLRTRRFLGVVGALMAISVPMWATEGPFLGVEVGASKAANNNYRAHVEAGATANPYVGYMFNHYLGVQGDLHFVFQYPDNDHRGFEGENQITSLFGGTVGPRVSLPMSESLELFAVGEGGFFTGLSGRLLHTSGGVSAGGGFDYYVTPNLAVTVYGRWNRAATDQASQPRSGREPAGTRRRAVGGGRGWPEILLQPPRSGAASSASASTAARRAGATTAGQEEDCPAQRPLRFRQVDHPVGRRAGPG
jgi:hypothetical protein